MKIPLEDQVLLILIKEPFTTHTITSITKKLRKNKQWEDL